MNYDVNSSFNNNVSLDTTDFNFPDCTTEKNNDNQIIRSENIMVSKKKFNLVHIFIKYFVKYTISFVSF